jgi:hypothetical protein
MNTVQWDLTGNWTERLQQILDVIPEAMDIAAELVAICLNPWDKDNDITADWVMKNISSHRVAKIIAAQSEVNKYRDFFSNGSQLFQTLNRQ